MIAADRIHLVLPADGSGNKWLRAFPPLLPYPSEHLGTNAQACLAGLTVPSGDEVTCEVVFELPREPRTLARLEFGVAPGARAVSAPFLAQAAPETLSPMAVLAVRAAWRSRDPESLAVAHVAFELMVTSGAGAAGLTLDPSMLRVRADGAVFTPFTDIPSSLIAHFRSAPGLWCGDTLARGGSSVCRLGVSLPASIPNITVELDAAPLTASTTAPLPPLPVPDLSGLWEATIGPPEPSQLGGLDGTCVLRVVHVSGAANALVSAVGHCTGARSLGLLLASQLPFGADPRLSSITALQWGLGALTPPDACPYALVALTTIGGDALDGTIRCENRYGSFQAVPINR